jgi:hypothetical protein
MQVDWSPFKVVIAGQLVLVHALSVILCHCRKLFVAFFRGEEQHVLLEGLAHAFEYFDGCAMSLVLDNMATAILGRIGPNRKPLWHPVFQEFARHYGIDPFACKVQDPDRKGKIEKPFRFIYDDFLKGETFRSWEHLNAACSHWLDGQRETEVCNWRIHGTTGERPNEAYLAEREFLIRLPRERFPVYKDSDRIVDTDATLSVAGKKYNVPTSLANRTVRVHLYASHFEVMGPHGQVAFSRTYAGPEERRKLVLEPTLYAGLPQRPHASAHRERLDEAFLRRFPTMASLVDGLKLRMKTLAPVHLRTLLRLAERYGHDAFLAAATRAQEFKRFDSLAVSRILERDHPEPPDEPIIPLTGAGAVALGEVDPGSLDNYKDLDRAPASERTSASPDDTDRDIREADLDKEDSRGS